MDDFDDIFFRHNITFLRFFDYILGWARNIIIL